ncbi:hypothetical protein [Streptomyces siamensis]
MPRPIVLAARDSCRSPPLLAQTEGDAVLAGLVVCRVTGVSPVGALRAAGHLVWALPGTRFEIEQGRTAVLVTVR